jgi:hypothetical protein
LGSMTLEAFDSGSVGWGLRNPLENAKIQTQKPVVVMYDDKSNLI